MLSQQYEETVSQYSTTLESIVAEVEPLEELTLVMPVEGTRMRSSKRERINQLTLLHRSVNAVILVDFSYLIIVLNYLYPCNRQ